jgi:hypothetical protein
MAMLNASAALGFVHSLTSDVPSQIAPENISTVVNAKGATDTTYFVPAPALPLTEILRVVGVPDTTVDVLDDALRPIIDAGYSRNDKPGDPRPYLDHGVLTTHRKQAQAAAAAPAREVPGADAVRSQARAAEPAAESTGRRATHRERRGSQR